MSITILGQKAASQFDAIRTIGSLKQGVEGSILTVTSNHSEIEDLKESLESNNIDDTRYFFDKEDGFIGIKERFSLGKIVKDLKEFRNKSKMEVSFDRYLEAAQYTAPRDHTKPMTLTDVFNLLGFNPATESLANFVTTSPYADSRELVPELIRAFIVKDLIEQSPWRQLVSQTRRISQTQEVVPNVNYAAAAAGMEVIAENVNVPLGTLSFGRKTVGIKQRGVGIIMSDEVFRYIPYNLLGRYMMDVTTRMNNDLMDELVGVLVNGDFPGLTDPIGVMGVANTGDKIKYTDLMRVFIRYMRTRYRPTTFLANEAEALRLLNDADFKPSGNNAAPRFNLQLGNSGMINSSTLLITDQTADDDMILMDPGYALEFLESQPLELETARNAANAQNAYYMRMTCGFANLYQAAKLMLSGDLAYASYGFPSYLTLKK